MGKGFSKEIKQAVKREAAQSVASLFINSIRF